MIRQVSYCLNLVDYYLKLLKPYSTNHRKDARYKKV